MFNKITNTTKICFVIIALFAISQAADIRKLYHRCSTQNSTNHLENAPLRKNESISIGGVEIECIHEYMPSTGTRMRVQ